MRTKAKALVTVILRLEPKLKDRLYAAARKMGMSANAYMTLILASAESPDSRDKKIKGVK